jgi:hypothetical protein
MLYSGLIYIIKIIKLDEYYQLHIDLEKSVESLKSLSQYYKIINDNEIIINVRLNPLMLCNIYDRFKIKTTKKFIEIDFSNSNVYIKLDINDLIISVTTMTKTETQVNNKVQTKNKQYKITQNIRKKFTSELIDICKKI